MQYDTVRSSLSGKELVKQIWKKYKNTYTNEKDVTFLLDPETEIKRYIKHGELKID